MDKLIMEKFNLERNRMSKNNANKGDKEEHPLLAVCEATTSAEAANTAGAPREFLIRRKPFRASYTIWQQNGTPYGHPVAVHWVNIGPRVGNSPELALLAEARPDAETLAVCHMPAFGLDVRLGFGNPDKDVEMIWEDMVAGVGTDNKTEYKIELSMYRSGALSTGMYAEEQTAEDGPCRKREFYWRRYKGDEHAPTARDWKFIDGEGVLVATYLEDTTKGICGSLTLEDPVGSDLDHVVMISILALCERRRRS